jgi:chromate transporter
MKTYIELFLTFVKIGAVTFGGGYAMMPVLERELIKKRGWASMDEIMDYYTIAQVTPGIIAVNVSTFVGYKQKGPFGGLLATLGFVLPGIGFVSAIALGLQNFAEYPEVQHGFTGIRVAVGALIIDTVAKLLKGTFKDAKSAAIFVLAFSFSVALKANPVFLIAAAGFAGFSFYRASSKKPDREKK